MFEMLRPSKKKQLDDEEVLLREIRWARESMSQTRARLQNELLQAVNPKAWTELHPWLSVGAAAAAGFVAARAVNTPREERIIARYLRRRNRDGAPPPPPHRGRMQGLFSLLQTAAVQIPALLSQFQAAQMQEAAAEQTDKAVDARTHGASPPTEDAASYEPPRSEFANGY